jgi:2-C-methyl-D-erythritol 4-phosphate cytidylyltransferase
MAMVSVIIPAAGSGSRFGAGYNKIFAPLCGEAMIARTLRAFLGRSDVGEIILPCSPDDRGTLGEALADPLASGRVTLVTGGACRSESVRNGLARVSARADLVAVHDAARPCVSQATIDATFAAADAHGAALPAVAIHGTIKRARADGRVSATLPREQFADLFEAQTPQVARRDILTAAYATGLDATDDVALIEAIGQPVHIVPGDLRNIKVTTPDDLALAEALLATLE